MRPGRRPGGRGSTATVRFVGAVVLAVVLVRLTYLGQPLRADEAGYLLVARDWHTGGPNLYGHYWVDRPPLLLALFKVGSLMAWPQAVRLVVLPFAALMVTSAAWAAYQVTGRRGARWAAVVAAALVTTPALGAQGADGEIFAAPLVMLGVALTLDAMRSIGGRRAGMALLAGLAAGSAAMVKQSFVDGLVFAAVLVTVSAARGAMSRRSAAVVLGCGAVGAVLPLASALVWVGLSRVAMADFWFDMFGFRWSAADVVGAQSLRAPLLRAVILVGLATVAGLVPMLLVLCRRAWKARLRGSPLAWAIGLTTAYALVGIVGGASFWGHYLLQLAPMAALAAGVWAPRLRSMRSVAELTVVSAVVSTLVFLSVGVLSGHRDAGRRVGEWVGESARSRDTLTVLYGHAEVQEAAGLRSRYEHLWSLPMRTLDPELDGLRGLLRASDGPTWVVAWTDLNSWGIDADHALRDDLEARYRIAGVVCGKEVWLREGVDRQLAPRPRC